MTKSPISGNIRRSGQDPGDPFVTCNASRRLAYSHPPSPGRLRDVKVTRWEAVFVPATIGYFS